MNGEDGGRFVCLWLLTCQQPLPRPPLRGLCVRLSKTASDSTSTAWCAIANAAVNYSALHRPSPVSQPLPPSARLLFMFFFLKQLTVLSLTLLLLLLLLSSIYYILYVYWNATVPCITSRGYCCIMSSSFPYSPPHTQTHICPLRFLHLHTHSFRLWGYALTNLACPQLEGNGMKRGVQVRNLLADWQDQK